MVVEGRLRVLGHPGVAAALIVLVVNDHVLKAWSADQGVVARTFTGKASDLAGVLLVAVLAGVVTGRRRAALVGVGLAFAALKLSPAVAEAVAPLLGGGATRTDPWDLLALVALLPAGRILAGPDTRSPAAAAPRRDRPSQRTLGLAVLVASLPAITATSPADDEPACYQDATVVLVAPDRAGLVAAVGLPEGVDALLAPTTATTPSGVAPEEDPAATLQWYRSGDGVDAWEETDAPFQAAALADGGTDDEGCTATTCYRSSGTQVEERPRSGGSWERSFALAPAELAATRSGCPARPATFGPVAVVGETVVVAHGNQGVVRRIGDGRWLRVDVGSLAPSRPHPVEPVDDDDGVDGVDGPADLVGTAARGDLGPPGQLTVLLLATTVLLFGAGLVRPRRGLMSGAGVALLGLFGYWVAIVASVISFELPSLTAPVPTALWGAATLGLAAVPWWRRRREPPAAASGSGAWATGPAARTVPGPVRAPSGPTGPPAAPPRPPDPGDPSPWARPPADPDDGG